MRKFSEGERKFIIGIAIASILLAIVAIGIRIGRGGELSLFVPLLLVVSAFSLLLMANKNKQ